MAMMSGLRRWRLAQTRNKEMRRFADTLIDPIRAQAPARPEQLFEALVQAAIEWRGRPIYVHKVNFPAASAATGLWLERTDHDDVLVEKDAVPWHQTGIFGHEMWHMYKMSRITPDQLPGHGDPQPVAARTDFLLAEEREAELFGLLVGQRMRSLMELPSDTDDLAGRIGAALNYRGGTRR
ncbi:toxin [Streptomyces sp. MMS24-I2-30]|uniref:toxin n=1 Tax=Streptomyces sp. MMS24-I2-30 TaxID=3351564 RepID=UPI003896B2B6